VRSSWGRDARLLVAHRVSWPNNMPMLSGTVRAMLMLRGEASFIVPKSMAYAEKFLAGFTVISLFQQNQVSKCSPLTSA
jgi:hypothetical protein